MWQQALKKSRRLWSEDELSVAIAAQILVQAATIDFRNNKIKKTKQKSNEHLIDDVPDLWPWFVPLHGDVLYVLYVTDIQ